MCQKDKKQTKSRKYPKAFNGSSTERENPASAIGPPLNNDVYSFIEMDATATELTPKHTIDLNEP